MEKYSFFNSVNGDRKYKAEDYAVYFSKFITNGVFPNVASNFQVIADSSDMTTKVKAGAAWINGYMYYNDSDLILTHDVADGVLNRIDRIVVKLDYQQRLMKSYIKKGVFASTPVASTLQRDADGYELALADVYIGNGAISITQANVTDLRLNTAFCGMVNSLLQADTTAIFNQYQSWFDQMSTAREQEFDDWFATVQGQLSGDIAGNLQNQITQSGTDVGDLPTLQTVEKGNLVGAVNEVSQTVVTHLADYVKHPGFAVTSGAANAYTATLNPAPTAYEDGFGIVVAIHAAATGASTLNINGLGDIPLKKSNGNGVTKLDLNGVYTFRYKNGNFTLQGEGGEYGTVAANDVRSTKTFGTENGVLQGALDLTNLQPSNIKLDINIDGVTGTLKENPFKNQAVSTQATTSSRVYGLNTDGELYISGGTNVVQKIKYGGTVLQTWNITTANLQWFCEARYCTGIANGAINLYAIDGTLLATNQDGQFQTSFGLNMFTFDGNTTFCVPSGGSYIYYCQRGGAVQSASWGAYLVVMMYCVYDKARDYGRIVGFGGSSGSPPSLQVYTTGGFISVGAFNVNNYLFYNAYAC